MLVGKVVGKTMAPEMTCIVAATSVALGIGKDGGLPWKLVRSARVPLICARAHL